MKRFQFIAMRVATLLRAANRAKVKAAIIMCVASLFFALALNEITAQTAPLSPLPLYIAIASPELADSLAEWRVVLEYDQKSGLLRWGEEYKDETGVWTDYSTEDPQCTNAVYINPKDGPKVVKWLYDFYRTR